MGHKIWYRLLLSLGLDSRWLLSADCLGLAKIIICRYGHGDMRHTKLITLMCDCISYF